MKRILVIGSPGSGKTTLCLALARQLDLPCVHLDRLFWKPGWVQRDNDEFDALLAEELRKENWIIDGNYNRTIAARLARADTVIFLDFNRWICTWRIVARWLLRQGYQAEGCPQKIDLPFLKYVLLDYRREARAQTLALKKQLNDKLEWVTLRSRAEVQDYLSRIAG